MFRRGLWAGAGGLLIVVVISAWFIATHRNNTGDDGENWPTNAAQPPPGNGMPTLMVRQAQTKGTPNPGAISAEPLMIKLRDAFARFDAINVASDGQQLNRAFNYELNFSIDYHHDLTTDVTFRLVDPIDGNQIWTQSFTQDPQAADPTAFENTIVTKLAYALLQPFGLIHSRDRAKQLTSGQGDPRYRCLLLTADALRSFVPSERNRARACLEHLTAIDPTFGDGFAFLSIVYVRQYQDETGASPSLLDRAKEAVRHAIELTPQSARAYELLGLLLFVRHDNVGGFAALEKAVSLNKFAPNILSQYGGRLIMVGDIDRGMEILSRVAELYDVRPTYDHFFIFLGYYLRGNIAEARLQADQIVEPKHPRGLLAHTLLAAASRDLVQAKEFFQRLVDIQPGWRGNPRQELDKFIPGAEVVERLTKDLVVAGLTSDPLKR